MPKSDRRLFPSAAIAFLSLTVVTSPLPAADTLRTVALTDTPVSGASPERPSRLSGRTLPRYSTTTASPRSKRRSTRRRQSNRRSSPKAAAPASAWPPVRTFVVTGGGDQSHFSASAQRSRTDGLQPDPAPRTSRGSKSRNLPQQWPRRHDPGRPYPHRPRGAGFRVYLALQLRDASLGQRRLDVRRRPAGLPRAGGQRRRALRLFCRHLARRRQRPARQRGPRGRPGTGDSASLSNLRRPSDHDGKSARTCLRLLPRFPPTKGRCTESGASTTMDYNWRFWPATLPPAPAAEPSLRPNIGPIIE